ncbi:MAG: methylated-DNA-protein-cysteine methyltransferase-like protein [Cognaticolwellia sp.]|jgi:methylated-DNA-protein-cysteine methyltransferase-like protein
MLLWIIITYPIEINVNKLIKPHYAQIWQTIQLIPQGKVACYGQIADLAGLPGKARLVGKALGCLSESGWRGQVVPWYRVINAQGKISFPIGSEYFEKQKQFLQNEQVVIIGAKIKLKEFQWQPDLAELLFSLEF